MCHLYQSVIKRRANQKIEANVVEIKVKKEIHTFRLRGRRNYESPNNARSSSPRLSSVEEAAFALKRGQK